MTDRASTAYAIIFDSIGSVNLIDISVHDGARVSDLKDLIGAALGSRGQHGFDVYLTPRDDPGWACGLNGSLVALASGDRKTLERFATLDAAAVGQDFVSERIHLGLVYMVQLLVVRREPHDLNYGAVENTSDDEGAAPTDGPGGWRSWVPFLSALTGDGASRAT